ncbi:unnamed protein product [Parnassius mnemosyne]|uniref:Endonuclease/exonuclease/phosphatase domain-containing protein n=1 Tax=Parnassius mnemosyne TaxID=213953 RepID=A0AAV1LTK3_9NEOP
MANLKGKSRVLQANFHHAAAASAVVEVCFAEENIDLALIQEPWVANGQVLGLTAAAVLEYCNDDLVTAFINLKGCTGARVIICSGYLPGENPGPAIELERVAKFARKHNAELVVGCDANAHHTAWGSTNINERVHQMSRRITDWHASSENSISDHRHIKFVIRVSTTYETVAFRDPKATSWDIYSDSLRSNLETFPKSIKTIEGLELAVETVTVGIREAFEDSCPVKNKTSTRKVP